MLWIQPACIIGGGGAGSLDKDILVMFGWAEVEVVRVDKDTAAKQRSPQILRDASMFCWSQMLLLFRLPTHDLSTFLNSCAYQKADHLIIQGLATLESLDIGPHSKGGGFNGSSKDLGSSKCLIFQSSRLEGTGGLKRMEASKVHQFQVHWNDFWNESRICLDKFGICQCTYHWIIPVGSLGLLQFYSLAMIFLVLII